MLNLGLGILLENAKAKEGQLLATDFGIKTLSETDKEDLLTSKLWEESAPFHLNRLRIINIQYYDFGQKLCSGQIMTLELFAESVRGIFYDLYKLKFPIHKVVLIDKYRGNDDESMADNNSSCYNFRKIAGSNQLSMHAYGAAIDINPIQNPYVKLDKNGDPLYLTPIEGKVHFDGKFIRKHEPGYAENVKGIFAKHGFKIWGGDWREARVDYQHFQIDRQVVESVINLDMQSAKAYFENYKMG